MRELKVIQGAKMMVVGSTIDDVITVQPPSPGELKKLNDTVPGTRCMTKVLQTTCVHTHTHTHHTAAPPKESLSEHKDHKKMIEKGKPDDAPVGIKHRKVSFHTDVGS